MRPSPLSSTAVAVNWHAAFNAREIDAALDGHHPGCELVDLGRERLTAGIGELALWLTTWLVGFPDARFEELEVEDVATGVAARAVLVGTHRGPFAGVAATGREVRLPITDVLRFDRAGMVVRHFLHHDATTLFEQLGVEVPPAYPVR